MKRFFIIVLGVFSFLACKKDLNTISLERSVWVESSDKTDTILFINGSLILNRPKEVRNGYLLPRFGAGPYSFREVRDSIGLMHSVSSLYRFKNYAFKVEQNRLFIGDFYQKSSKQNQLLTFDRLR